MVTRNANEAIVVPMVGVWRSLRLAGVCSRFCVGMFGRNLASVSVMTFSHLI
jgi:hypothetical protein